jgi:hypothetical protein
VNFGVNPELLSYSDRRGWLNAGCRGRYARTVTTSVQDGSASRRENHHVALNRHKTVNNGVFPYGVSRARALPSFHGFGICSRTTGNPGEELKRQRAS